MTKIVASCPHCFNTLANEYPDFGGRYEVMHHSELLADLVRDGRLAAVAGSDATITYHDSCYLARHNDVLAAPREIVSRIGKPLEMARSGKRTFCCGAGGAHLWMEERGNQINEERAREAAATGADTLAVACPFCTVMLDDGVRQTGGRCASPTSSTLLAEALEQRATRRGASPTRRAAGVLHAPDARGPLSSPRATARGRQPPQPPPRALAIPAPHRAPGSGTRARARAARRSPCRARRAPAPRPS